MPTTVDHNYGISTTPKIPPMLAVPLSGTVNIIVTDQSDKTIGETIATQSGRWRNHFALEDGIYVIEFKGKFRPIGSGYGSMYQTLVNSTKIAIRVPLNSELPPLDPNNLPKIDTSGKQGSKGELGPTGPVGSQGSTGESGASGESGVAGEIGPTGPQGDQGSMGIPGAKGNTGQIGSAGTAGKAGPKGDSGSTGAVGKTGPKGPEILYIINPLATDKKFIAYFNSAKSISQIYGQTDTGSITFNIKYTPQATPNGAGTSIIYPDIVADNTGISAIPNTIIPTDSWLFYEASDISGSPTKLWVYLIIS